MIETNPTATKEETPCVEDDHARQLANLLADGVVRQRCIDRVANNLDAILAARARKITWNAIAAALEMPRCTLINAVNTLKSRNNRTQMKPNIPKSSYTSTSVEPVWQPIEKAPSKACVNGNDSIKTVGRARRENFNF
ncbi:MAG: hypothetical protein ACXWJF_10650 [Burkholderiaceae bacterium]